MEARRVCALPVAQQRELCALLTPVAIDGGLRRVGGLGGVWRGDGGP